MIDLLRETITDPPAAWRRLVAANPTTAQRLGLIVASAAGGAALSGLAVMLMPEAVSSSDAIGRMAHLPLALGAVQVLSALFAALLLSEAGRIFRGTGRFRDALLAVGWVELVLVALQAAQLLVMLALPLLGGLLALAIVCIAIYLAVRFTMLVHGFTNPVLVVLGMIGTVLLAGVALSLLVGLLAKG